MSAEAVRKRRYHPPRPYAYECTLCDHLASRHRLLPDGKTGDGPYECWDCGCHMSQSTPCRELTKGQYQLQYPASYDPSQPPVR